MLYTHTPPSSRGRAPISRQPTCKATPEHKRPSPSVSCSGCGSTTHGRGNRSAYAAWGNPETCAERESTLHQCAGQQGLPQHHAHVASAVAKAAFTTAKPMALVFLPLRLAAPSTYHFLSLVPPTFPILGPPENVSALTHSSPTSRHTPTTIPPPPRLMSILAMVQATVCYFSI